VKYNILESNREEMTEMNKLQKGIAGAVTGVVLGIFLTSTIDALAKDGTLPGYFVWSFGLMNIILNIATINALRYAGMLYTIGWLIGSLIMRDVLGPLGIAFNIAGPALIIIARAYFWFKSLSSNNIEQI
jgi:hypothetical protein